MKLTPEESIVDLYRLATSGDIDTVFERLGMFDPELPLGAQPPTRAEYIAAGRSWWERNRPAVRSYLCGSDAIRKSVGRVGSHIAEAAFGLLAAHFGGPLATYASVVFVQEAIGDALDEAVMRRFCNWCGDQEAASPDEAT